MAKWEGWEKVEEGIEIPIVFVLNMDIAKSKALASVTHPMEHQKKVNDFQSGVQKILSGDKFFSDRWSGDGLVVLYKDKEAEADDLIGKAIEIISLIQKNNDEKYFAVTVGLRMGITVGTIIFQKQIGSIISDVMNKAGLFQKSCPGTGGIFMADSVLRFIKNQNLKEKFKPSLFMIGQEIRAVYYYPQLSSDETPPFITSTGVTKEIDLSKLFTAVARFSDLDKYLPIAEAQAKDAQEIILTGRAPTWLYLHAAFKLKSTIRRLLYRDGNGHLFQIFDHTLR